MSTQRILAVDDEPHVLGLCREVLADAGYRVDTVGSAAEALDHIRTAPYDLILTDMRMPGQDGLDLMRDARAMAPGLPFVLITGYPSIEDTVDAMRVGAVDVITKPFDNHKLCHAVDRALGKRRKAAQADDELLKQNLPGNSPAMVHLRQVIAKVAMTESTVLICGEGGTGKELVARTLHQLSSRSRAPFVAVDAATLNSGYGERLPARPDEGQEGSGWLETLCPVEGTLFLDDVSELEPAMQARLLRFLDRNSDREPGPRVITACRSDLQAAVSEGSFREDLYFSLKVIPIQVPPLRRRLEDLAGLACEFLADYAAQHPGMPVRISEDGLVALRRYGWPGNVRELRNVLERMASMAEGGVLTAGDVPMEIIAAAAGCDTPESAEGLSFRTAKQATVARFEREFLHQLLADHGGNVTRCARQAGLNRSAFQRLMRKHGLRSQLYRTPAGGRI